MLPGGASLSAAMLLMSAKSAAVLPGFSRSGSVISAPAAGGEDGDRVSANEEVPDTDADAVVEVGTAGIFLSSSPSSAKAAVCGGGSFVIFEG